MSKYQKTSEMCSPVKGSACNDKSTAVVQKQTNPARMKNQWALRNCDNDKVPLPVRANGEAPLAEQPSAFSCSPRPAPAPRPLSPSSIQAQSHWSKLAQNLGEKEKSIIWGDTERCRKLALKTKPKPGQPRIWKAGEELLGAQNSAREGMNPHPTEKTDYSHTHTQIKYCHQFFCKVIPHSSGQPMSNKCDFPECSWIKLEAKDKFGLLVSVSDLSPLITRFAAKRNSSQIMAAIQTGREEISQETPHNQAQ